MTAGRLSRVAASICLELQPTQSASTLSRASSPSSSLRRQEGLPDDLFLFISVNLAAFLNQAAAFLRPAG
jgi:hypothetical protein